MGIAIGVAAMIFALALSRGLREEIQEKLLSSTPHVRITKTDGGGIENSSSLKEGILQIDGVARAGFVMRRNALLVTARANAYAVLDGREEIQPERKDGCVAVSVGKVLAEQSSLAVGGQADAIVGSSESDDPKKFCLTVKDTVETGIHDLDATLVRLSLADFQRVTGERPSSVEVSIGDVYASRTAANKIKERLGAEYTVVEWQETNQPLFAAMYFERRVVLIIISLVLLLSAVNIAFTLYLSIAQRRQDIAVLRTLGARSPNMVLAFLFEGLFLGMIGVISGVVLGLLACTLANYFDLIKLPGEVYIVSSVVLKPATIEVLSVVGSALLIVLFATVIPALSVARVKPWENLRK